MKKALVIALLGILFNTGYAANRSKKDNLKQIKRIEILSLDTLGGYDSKYAYPDENLNDLFAEQMDSLYHSWYVQNAYDVSFFQNDIEPSELAELPDSVYIQRLQSIDSFVDLSFNKTVKNFINLYTVRRHQLTEMILGLSTFYFPIIEEKLDQYDLPQELKYMPIIESALNPTARSRANAVGLWQFMYPTGKMYKLDIGTFLDERRDPEKASEAAAKYLSDLYKIYKNWHLVIAAYNCGPGNVNKAIRRAGGARDYWSIYYYLPRETRGYVPAFIAAAYFMNFYQEHNLTPRYPEFPIVTDTLQVRNYVHFDQISEVLNVPKEEIESLNPQYRLDIIPAKPDKPYALRLPLEKITEYIDMEEDIYALNRDKYFPNNEILVPKERGTYVADVNGKDRIVYTVKSGDNLGYIANRFHVRINDLRYWNNIHRNLIRIGQKIVVYVPAGKGADYAQSGNVRLTSQASASTQITSDGNFVYYTVRRGDSLWSIARRFPGVSNQDIMRLNGLSNSAIKPGQKLKIQPKS